jgi:hypothetical protein
MIGVVAKFIEVERMARRSIRRFAGGVPQSTDTWHGSRTRRPALA